MPGLDGPVAKRSGKAVRREFPGCGSLHSTGTVRPGIPSGWTNNSSLTLVI